MTVMLMGLTTLISFECTDACFSYKQASKQAHKQAASRELLYLGVYSIAGSHMYDVRKDSQQKAVMEILGSSS